jgi:hypothetical protein
MSVHMKFFRALVASCFATSLILGVFAAVSARDAFASLSGLAVAGLFAIALAVIAADAKAERRSGELNLLVERWIEQQRLAEKQEAERAKALPVPMADGPRLLPKRKPVEPGRGFPIQDLDGYVRLEVAV